jgi:hypothetical protein
MGDFFTNSTRHPAVWTNSLARNRKFKLVSCFPTSNNQLFLSCLCDHYYFITGENSQHTLYKTPLLHTYICYIAEEKGLCVHFGYTNQFKILISTKKKTFWLCPKSFPKKFIKYLTNYRFKY